MPLVCFVKAGTAGSRGKGRNDAVTVAAGRTFRGLKLHAVAGTLAARARCSPARAGGAAWLSPSTADEVRRPVFLRGASASAPWPAGGAGRRQRRSVADLC